MRDFIVAIGLVLVIEGFAYAMFPDGIRTMAQHLLKSSSSTLRNFGVIAMMIGVAIVWLARSLG